MSRSLKASAVLLLMASCTVPPFFVPEEFPPIEGIRRGDSADHVREVLGKPYAWEDGWWRDGGIRYESDFQVWFYAGKGRVVLDGSGHVVQSEADPRQPGRSVSQPDNDLYRTD
jgi:hypothetical protein